ncbi:Dynein heavy chain [Phytophthora cactorum]|nr:Dynein heavy chain [Phytophthora cactorum]
MSGTLEKNALDSLALMLRDVFVPLIGNPRNQQMWPEMVTMSIINNVHGFFSSLQITLGQTKALRKVMESTAKSSLQGDAFNSFSLEGCLITWTKQIKNILKQDPEALLNQRDHTHQGPMEELHFWAAKAKNLNSIFAQPQSDSIRIVLQYLDASKSTYNVPFAKLCKEVFLARAEANDNKHYLWPLAKWFEQLASAQTLPEIRDLFRPICHSILLIWKSSRFYNTPARLVVLIRQICNEIIKKAMMHLNGEKLSIKAS